MMKTHREKKRINRTVCPSVKASSHHQADHHQNNQSNQSINPIFKISNIHNITPQSTPTNFTMVALGFITAERPHAAVPASTSSPGDSRRSSAESSSKEAGSLKQIAQRTVAAIKRHHQEVNKAFDAVYGTKYYR
jgi:hypothetical protein